MTELTIFEPGELTPPELAEVANREHQAAVDALGSAVNHWLMAGQALIAAKTKVAHGEWLPWLETNFVASHATAKLYMYVARNGEYVRHLDDTTLTGMVKALRASNGRAERDAAIKARRAQQLQLAQASMADDEHRVRLEVADIHAWRPTGVNAIITDPPYITDDALKLHRALGEFAMDVLPDGGALAILTWQPLLPDVCATFRLYLPELIYRWTAAWIYETTARTPEHKPRVFDGWKPILVYHKRHIPEDATFLYDTITSPDADKDHHEWGQSPEGFMHLVRAFTSPGETVCDPFLGGGTTAFASVIEDRRFVGADIAPAALDITRARLA